MFRKVLCLCLISCLVTLLGYDIQNPALSPVTLGPLSSHSPLVLIRGGRSKVAIAAARSREAGMIRERQSICKAVQVLQEAFEKCGGVTLPVYEPDSPELTGYEVILAVGDSHYARQLGIRFQELPREGFTVKSGKNILAIVGYDGSLIPGTYDALDWSRYRLNGTLHGAYDFVERIMGCRFYYPGVGCIFPKLSDLVISPLHYSDQPYFQNRHSHTILVASNPKNFYPEMAATQWEDWEGRYRIALGTRYWAGHAPIISGMEKDYPDKQDLIYYRDDSGFLYRNPKQHIGNYFDITNLKLADLMIESLHRHYDSRGKHQTVWTNNCANAEYITFGQCDTLVMNLSNEVTRRLHLIDDSRKGSLDGELSDVHARFIFYLAERIKREFPGKRLSLMPYHNYVLPPTKPEYQVFPDNVDLRVCIYDYPTKVPDEKTNRKWLEHFKAYYKMLGNRPVSSIWLYDAPRDRFARSMSGRYLREIPKIMGKYLGRTELFWDYFGNHEWENYYNYYIMWRCQWNPEFNIDAALDEHWNLLYGDAAPYVREFYGLVRQRYETIAAVGGDRKKAYNAKVLDRLEQLLALARKAVPKGSREERSLILFSRPWPKAIKEMRGFLAFDKPQVRIAKVKPEELRLDGIPRESCWNLAPAIPLKDAMGTGEAGTYPSQAKLLYTEQGLYGLVLSQGTPSMDSTKSMWENCTLEIFLSPGLNAQEYYQFAFDGAGQRFAGHRTLKPMATPFQQREDITARSVSTVENGMWRLEFFIPWKDLKGKRPLHYQTWLGNLVVSRKSPGKEYLSFSMTMGNNHHTEQFGYLKFLGEGDR